MKRNPTIQPKRVFLAVAVLLVVAAIHIFRLGSYLSGGAYNWYYSYFSDIVVPIGFYFLLCINDLTIPPLRPWWVKALLIFGAASGAEIAQGFGVPILGATFDPVDFLMFAIGTGLAVGLDAVFSRVFGFWKFGA